MATRGFFGPVVGRRMRRVLVPVASAAAVAAGLGTIVAQPAFAADLTAYQVGARANATRVDFPVGDRVDATVDVGTGNLSVLTSDLKLPGIQHDLQLGMTFNSLLVGAVSGPGGGAWQGGGGYGWSTRLGSDLRVNANADGSVTYFAPDGQQCRFTVKTTTTYNAPAGFKADLVKTGSTGWTLRDHTSNEKTTFNAAGKVTAVTDRNGQATTFAYAYGWVSHIVSTRSGTKSREADFTTTAATGIVTGISQDNDTTGARGATYGYTGNQLTSILDTAARTTTFGYTGGTATTGGDLTSIVTPGGATTTIGYDTAHRVLSVSRANPGGTATTRFAYPSSTQTLAASPTTNQAMAVAAVPHTTYTLDATDRVTTAVDPLSRSQSATYTPFADVNTTTAPGGGSTSTTHTANGGESLTGVTGAMGSGSAASYANPSPSQYLPSGGTDAQGNAAVLSYDGVGNQQSTANSGTAATAAVTYNSDGTLATSTSPASKVTTYTETPATHQISTITPPAGSGLGATGLTYDGYGRLATVTDGRGAVTTYGYDNLDRVTGISYSGTGAATTAISYGYDTAGNQHTRTDGTGTTTYGYDGLARLTSRVATAGGGTLTYGYDPAGNLTSYGNGVGTTTYTYDDANQLATDTSPTGAKDFYAFNADGKRTDTWWRANAAHTTFAAHTHTDFDLAGRIARTWTSSANTDTTRTYDTSSCYSTYVVLQPCTTTKNTGTDKGLIQWSIDNLTGARSVYSYDGANRLTGATNYGGHSYSYTYDVNGNRTTQVTDGTTTQTLTFDTASNQITSAGGWIYDAAGNLSHHPTFGNLTYTQAGQMASAGTATYTYAGTGQNELTHQDLNVTGQTYDYTYSRPTPQGVPTLDSVTKGGTTTTFITNDPVTGAPQGMTLSTGQNDYFATDGQGSVVGLIAGTSGGTVLATYTYDPYGVITATAGSGTAFATNPYFHAGGLGDPKTSWNRHGTRYNDNTTGRWTTQDPIGHLLNPDSANPYTYGADSPINYTDPTGKDIYDDLAYASELLVACGTTGLAAGIVGGEIGFFADPVGGEVAGGFIGFIYGCGAGIFSEAIFGYAPEGV